MAKEATTPKGKETASDYTQLCVWEGCVVGKKKIDDFTKVMQEEFSARIKYAEEVKTKPDTDSSGNPVPKTGGRNDLFFYVHNDDIPKFSLKRLGVGIRWWEDVLGNGGGKLYDESVLSKYPKTW